MKKSLYTQREANIRRTWMLFVIFLVVVIGVGWVFAQAYGTPVVLYIAVGIALVMNVIGYWYSDKIVLKMAKAVPVDRKNNIELYRLVENLAITAGLPMPKLYIIKESAPNAFATGRDPQHAVVAVTEGLMDKLDRSELEGVIAHELSHIGNRDMLLSTAVVVLVGFVSIISDIFLRSTMWGGFRNRDSNDKSGVIIMVVALVLSILAPIMAYLMQLAISRKREFLADASGVLLTRYPEGLAKALQKIAGDHNEMRVANSSTAHLWISSPFKKGGKRAPWFSKLLMTHPPVEERIKALRALD